MNEIRLDNPVVCQNELETCSNGLARLTQEATRNLEALGRIEEQLEIVEAVAASAVRDGADAKLTAAEINGRITLAIAEHPHLAPVREAAHELRAEAASLARRLRSLEKRSMNAQSALKKHDSEARNAGHSTGWPPPEGLGGRS